MKGRGKYDSTRQSQPNLHERYSYFGEKKSHRPSDENTKSPTSSGSFAITSSLYDVYSWNYLENKWSKRQPQTKYRLKENRENYGFNASASFYETSEIQAARDIGLRAKNISAHKYLMEEIQGNTLSDYLKLLNHRKTKINDLELIQLFRSVLQALVDFHDAGYAHCDIKLENTMVIENQPFSPIIKLIDTGHSKKEKQSNKRDGSSLYAGPEVFACTDNTDTSKLYDTRKKDVYSIGTLLNLLLIQEIQIIDFNFGIISDQGTYNFFAFLYNKNFEFKNTITFTDFTIFKIDKNKLHEIKANIADASIYKNNDNISLSSETDKNLRSLFSNMLQIDPNLRCTAQEALNHLNAIEKNLLKEKESNPSQKQEIEQAYDLALTFRKALKSQKGFENIYDCILRNLNTFKQHFSSTHTLRCFIDRVGVQHFRDIYAEILKNNPNPSIDDLITAVKKLKQEFIGGENNTNSNTQALADLLNYKSKTSQDEQNNKKKTWEIYYKDQMQFRALYAANKCKTWDDYVKLNRKFIQLTDELNNKFSDITKNNIKDSVFDRLNGHELYMYTTSKLSITYLNRLSPSHTQTLEKSFVYENTALEKLKEKNANAASVLKQFSLLSATPNKTNQPTNLIDKAELKKRVSSIIEAEYQASKNARGFFSKASQLETQMGFLSKNHSRKPNINDAIHLYQNEIIKTLTTAYEIERSFLYRLAKAIGWNTQAKSMQAQIDQLRNTAYQWIASERKSPFAPTRDP